MRIFRRTVVTVVCLPAPLLAWKAEKLKCLLGHFLGKWEAPPSALSRDKGPVSLILHFCCLTPQGWKLSFSPT